MNRTTAQELKRQIGFHKAIIANRTLKHLDWVERKQQRITELEQELTEMEQSE